MSDGQSSGGSERNWQGTFERYKDSLSALETWKKGIGGNHVLDYRDLGDSIDSDND